MILFSKPKFFIATVLSLLFISDNLRAQENEDKRHAVYLELGGVGFIYSFNYEYHLNKKSAVRAGGMFLRYNNQERQGDLNRYQGLIIPLTYNTFVGKKNHKLELGVGIVFQDFRVENNLPNRTERFVGIFDTDTRGLGLAGVIGYRYQPSKEGNLFRFALSLDASPGLDYDLGGGFGLSFGYIF